MNVTLCLHRGATEEEIAGLPSSWQRDLPGRAGTPVEVIWSKGVTPSASAYPCKNPGHKCLIEGRPDLWIPEDCGECSTCLARREIDGRSD